MIDHVDYCLSEKKQDAVANIEDDLRNSIEDENDDDVELKVERLVGNEMHMDTCQTTRESICNLSKARSKTCFLCNKSYASQWVLYM